ncbi:trichohyalin-like isoform X2 [Eriocheir sinensis]|uniref:trichohyalin-like isoform X2 n=1 Tax=Eriocheir sinensis TaxID=95602 RepID=UPI0021CA2090|nr:trichohyalin-like isoform X2 [Eriocheir sinensis]
MSGRGSEDSDAPKGPPAGGGPTVNGSIEATLTPELLFRMNKKIAQLTKVVYGLNTRGEELEAQLASAREAEETLKTTNSELQHRLSHCKSKVETELGRLRDLEAEAQQAHYWKHECENLRRRLDLESGIMGGGDIRAAVGAAREDAERAMRREKAVAYELEQARQAINNLKSHHDFIMRERDAQEAMEREKLELEWQTRLAEIENRYKSQVRRVTDDMEVLTAECDILRRRAADCGSGEASLREQIVSMEREHDQQRRTWELEMKMKEQDEQEELLSFGKERREYDARIRQLHEDKRLGDEQWDARLREQSREYERKLREAIDKRDAMQARIDEKEEGFETRLKAKVTEWKAEWDEVEEGLKDEIRRLKNECESLRSDSTLLRSRMERGGIESEMRIQDLEEQLRNKESDFENKTRNLMIRLSTVESVNKQQGQEKNAAERQMREEKDRHRQLRMEYDIMQRVKQELEQQIKRLSDSERQLQEQTTLLTVENEELKGEVEELKQKMKTKEKELNAKVEAMSKTAEAKVKARIEKTWLEKLRRSEENAAQDLERLREGNRRTEGDLRKELMMARKAEDEARRLNEEFKRKVRTLRQAETDATHKITELDDRVQELTKKLAAEGGPLPLASRPSQ